MSSDFKNKSSKIKKMVTKYIEEKDIPDYCDPLIVYANELFNKKCKGKTPLKDFINFTTLSQKVYYAFINDSFKSHPEVSTLIKICIGLELTYQECILLFVFSGYSFDFPSTLNIQLIDLISHISQDAFFGQPLTQQYSELIASDYGSYFNIDFAKFYNKLNLNLIG